MKAADLIKSGYIAEVDVPKVFRNCKVLGTKCTPVYGLQILKVNPRLLR